MSDHPKTTHTPEAEALAEAVMKAAGSSLKHYMPASKVNIIIACQEGIDKAAGVSPPKPRQPIIIEVRGGIVQNVLNLPPGIEYEIMDYDNREDV